MTDSGNEFEAPDIPAAAEVDRLTRALAALPQPAMPEEVTARLRATVANEAARREAAGAPSELSSEPSPRSASGRWLIALGGVAAAGVVGFAIVSGLDASTEPPTAASVAKPGSGEDDRSGSAEPSSTTGTVAGFSVEPVSSGTSYTQTSLAPMVSLHMADMPTQHPTAPVQAETFAASTAGIRSCVEGVGAAMSDLRMIDLADYEHLPSAVMAFRRAANAPTADVVVVGTLCNRTDPQVRARKIVLLDR